MRAMLAVCLLMGAATAAEPVASGVPVGKRCGPYSFLVATGPQKGQQTCYICEQEKKPTVVVFCRSLSDQLGTLLADLDTDATTHAEKGLKVWMTQLSEKADLDGLSKWSKKLGLKSIPVGAYEDVDGPPAYKLHADADITVLVFVKEKVTFNCAYRAKELSADGIQEIRKAVAEIMK
jgi:hypothetical protein